MRLFIRSRITNNNHNVHHVCISKQVHKPTKTWQVLSTTNGTAHLQQSTHCVIDLHVVLHLGR